MSMLLISECTTYANMLTIMGHSSSTRHFGRNHHVVLVVSWSNCQNFNQKFNFKQLCPWKSQNPSYGSKVMAILDKNKMLPLDLVCVGVLYC